jgi:tetratricopeptide (TPR) repeat protein
VAPSALILAGTLLVAPQAPGPAGRGTVPDLLHDGRFHAARAAIGPITQDSPPEDAFLQAFATYWVMIFDDDNEQLQKRLEKEIELALEAAERAAEEETDPTARLWSGNAHLVLAELRAGQRKSLSAAFEAKKAKKLLEAAAGTGIRANDALFGLGTYNYMADTLPSYIKGLRALLFIPKGDRAGGLEQLRRAAESSPTFGFEARVLLITIYAHKHERRYDEALAERDRLLAMAPDKIAGLYAAARLDLSLSRNRSAIAWVARAQERAARLGDVDPVVLRSLELLRARAELADLRPDLASDTARRAIESGDGLGPGIKSELESVLRASQEYASGIEWARVAEADAAALSALAEAAPADPRLALIAGDAQLRAGRGAEAAAWLQRAEGGGLARGWMGGCLLRQGQAADLDGNRARAVALYKRASETKGFPGKDAAYYHQAVPYRAGT